MAETKAITKATVSVTLADGGEFATWLQEMTNKANELAKQGIVAESIESVEDYKSAKQWRASANKVVKEIDEGRKVITSELDKAKRYVMDMAKQAASAAQDVSDKNANAIKAYEDRLRLAKKERLQTYWEQTYPTFALCTGEAANPLVAFDAIFEDSWTSTMSKMDNDAEPCKMMDSIATYLTESSNIISQLDYPEQVKDAALSELYRTRDLQRATELAKEEARRLADIKRLKQAEAIPVAQPIAEPFVINAPSKSGVRATTAEEQLESQVADTLQFIVEVHCYSAAEKDAAVTLMKANGLHGAVRKVNQ
jgi:hypothetical protein